MPWASFRDHSDPLSFDRCQSPMTALALAQLDRVEARLLMVLLAGVAAISLIRLANQKPLIDQGVPR
jgi:hypothetical protein